ncbi:NADP-dependent oxidoreductase [Janthinobacterium agaricidamnosum]|uniref:Zinc-binding dehydrogenase family protein n=1 Tax=Janthinobacterium agaricidamnosum NBRC 102515 = DSM 9628 TaxID=1349767 RepID=W0VCW9_9BURK|nr:NADP-dependent oxidoreductase [Janthinobacterium agaricidamnosum]CDG85223.1 zinc-binding dehydrogenase family protein [Janthinobacterium agaricidamnosum NBRC 102515 = DSM 9628]
MTTPRSLTQRQWIYRKQPLAEITPEHYQLVEQRLDTSLSANEVLIEARYFSVDPYMRIGQSSKPTYDSDAHPLDTVQAGTVVAQVLVSSSPAFAPGDWVSAYSGWQTHAKVNAAGLTLIDPQQAPVTTALGVLGMPGRTAWFGLTESGKPHAGEVVVVSGAAGAVGSLVAQFAKRHGARVLGIAGGAAKCDWLRDTLKLDWAVDYKAFADADALSADIKRLTGGVDVYFDNVGGIITDAVIPLINRRARIVICGQISQYSGGLENPQQGPRLLHHLLYQRATIQGMLARDYLHRMDEMRRIVGPWVKAGEIIFEETIIEGFEQLPHALNSLFGGEHRGKLMVKA